MTVELEARCEKKDGLYHLFGPLPRELAEGPAELIRALPGPSVFHIDGNASRCRVITTLVHGDEPYSLRTLLAVIKAIPTPATNIKIIVVAVEAAQYQPLFSRPFLPGERDLNRCFREPFLYQHGHVANAINNFLEDCQPEAVIDLHDSLAMSPTFALGANHTASAQAIVSLFTNTLIHSPLHVGALTDLPLHCPIIAVHAPAEYIPITETSLYRGLHAFFLMSDISLPQRDVSILSSLRRLELRRSAALAFSDKPVFGVNCTLRSDLENCNFSVQKPGDVLGWVDHNKLDHFRVVGQSAREKVSDYFIADDNCLTVIRPTRLFLISKNTDVAKSDCLFYFAAG